MPALAACYKGVAASCVSVLVSMYARFRISGHDARWCSLVAQGACLVAEGHRDRRLAAVRPHASLWQPV